MNPLTDVLPAKARKTLYAVLFVAALVFGLWQASNGDWVTFTGSVLTSLVGLLAASNTSTAPQGRRRLEPGSEAGLDGAH